MKTFLLLTLALGAFICATLRADDSAPAATSRVGVVFVEPEKFTDFNSDGYGMPSDRDIKYLTELFTDHLEGLAKRFIPEGERLEITFTDIDLAGRFEPERGPQMQNIRIYRDITYPRMTFSFRHLDADGQVISEGERKLTDLNYNMKIRLPGGDDEFRPDRDLLTDWMASTFRKRKP
jgi:hypothetical protein